MALKMKGMLGEAKLSGTALKLLEGAGDPALIAAAFLGNLCLL